MTQPLLSDLDDILSRAPVDPVVVAALRHVNSRITGIDRDMRDRALAAISEIQTLTLKRDDTLVVKFPADTQPPSGIRDALRRITGHTRILVVSDDVELTVLERE